MTARKRAGRATSEGEVHAYIHGGGKLGVLVEVNCETDFVARNDQFQEFVHNVAMHIAAANPLCVDPESLPQDVLGREREIYKAQALESGKPANVCEKTWKAGQEVLLRGLSVSSPTQGPGQHHPGYPERDIAASAKTSNISRFAHQLGERWKAIDGATGP
jgi:elongation factor Ts